MHKKGIAEKSWIKIPLQYGYNISLNASPPCPKQENKLLMIRTSHKSGNIQVTRSLIAGTNFYHLRTHV